MAIAVSFDDPPGGSPTRCCSRATCSTRTGHRPPRTSSGGSSGSSRRPAPTPATPRSNRPRWSPTDSTTTPIDVCVRFLHLETRRRRRTVGRGTRGRAHVLVDARRAPPLRRRHHGAREPAGEREVDGVAYDARRARRRPAPRGRAASRPLRRGTPPRAGREHGRVRRRTALSRDAVMRRSLVGTHCLLATDQGRFVSSIDPPEWARPAVEACEQSGASRCWSATPTTSCSARRSSSTTVPRSRLRARARCSTPPRSTRSSCSARSRSVTTRRTRPDAPIPAPS